MDEQKPKKLGRPFLTLDTKKIENLAYIGATYEQIGIVMECSADTIKDNYSEYVKIGRNRGIIALKQAAWSRALKSSDKLLMVLMNHYTEIKETPKYGSEMYIVPVKDVNQTAQLENDILEVRNLLDAKPKVV